MRMTTERVPNKPKFAISRDPKDLEDPANARYIYEDPNTGDRYIDWLNPDYRLEKYFDRLCARAHGTPDEITQNCKDAYYSNLCEKHGLFPGGKRANEIALSIPPRNERLSVENYEPEQIKKFRKMMTTYTTVTLIGSALITAAHERNKFAPLSYDAILKEMVSGINCNLDGITESFIGRLDKLARSKSRTRVDPRGVIGKAFLQAAKGILSDTPHGDLLRKMTGDTSKPEHAQLKMLLKTFDTVHQYDLDIKIEPSSIKNYRKMLESPETCIKIGKLIADGMRGDYGNSLSFVDMLSKLSEIRGETDNRILNMLLFNFDLMLKDERHNPYLVLGDAFLALAASFPKSEDRPHMLMFAGALPNAPETQDMKEFLDLMLEFDLVRHYDLHMRDKWLGLLEKIYPAGESTPETTAPKL